MAALTSFWAGCVKRQQMQWLAASFLENQETSDIFLVVKGKFRNSESFVDTKLMG